jgi:hypothetical protein
MVKQDIYDFLVKNLDLDSNLYNFKNLITKTSLIQRNRS